MRWHTEEKPYQCSQCKKFFIKCEPYKPYEVSHWREPLSMQTVWQGFSIKKILINHIGSHIGDKPYQCSQCEERPYKCNQCDKVFSKKSHLIDHMKIHTGNKPYNCSHILQSICGVTLRRDHINAVNVRKLFQQLSCHTFPSKRFL